MPVSIQEGDSTKTALLDVLDGVYMAADDKQVTVLIGLDLSAAFDTVHHEVLLQHLQSEIGVTAILLTWIHSYLEGRTQYVKLGQHQSHQLSSSMWACKYRVADNAIFGIANPVLPINYTTFMTLHIHCGHKKHTFPFYLKFWVNRHPLVRNCQF